MHTALHYSILNEEYALPVNHNALPGEDKHKWFKLIVYYTNHTQVEKRLLERENDRQTLRFLLTNAFCDTELDIRLTNLVQSLYRHCPILFSTILPSSEQMAGNEEHDDDEDEALVTDDEYHQRPSVIGCIRTKYCRDKGLPTRGQYMSSSFRRALATAYGRDYGMPNIVGFHNSSLQWCKKLTFTDG